MRLSPRPFGASISGCIIQAVNTGFGLKTIVQTGNAGFCVFPSLQSGTYDLRVEVAGSRTAEQGGVALDAALRRIIDFAPAGGAPR